MYFEAILYVYIWEQQACIGWILVNKLESSVVNICDIIVILSMYYNIV